MRKVDNQIHEKIAHPDKANLKIRPLMFNTADVKVKIMNQRRPYQRSIVVKVSTLKHNINHLMHQRIAVSNQDFFPDMDLFTFNLVYLDKYFPLKSPTIFLSLASYSQTRFFN